MPTSLPRAGHENTEPPDGEEVRLVSRGIASATAPPQGLTDTQRALIAAICESMTGHPADLQAPPIEPDEFASRLARRSSAFRERIVQLMVLTALVLRPLPADVATRVADFASELMVDDGLLDVARRFAEGDLGLAAIDFDRNGYASGWTSSNPGALHVSSALKSAWEDACDDPTLAADWTALESLPSDSLGRRVAEFYRARGFVYPGLPGSAPPLLAQHDWVHVVADYGTTVESELEVFAFIARANDDMRAFALLAMVVSLFETGYLERGAGLFEAAPGHLSERGMTQRVADAMRRGAVCAGSVDFLALDWFAIAEEPVQRVREHFGIAPKAPTALAAGSVGPWEIGGISPFQVEAGQRLARSQGGAYEAFGSRPVIE